MFCLVQLIRSKLSAGRGITTARGALVVLVSICCLTERGGGEDKTTRQRFVVEVSGLIRMNSIPVTGPSEMSRVEISSAGEVILALGSTEEPASSSDALFLLHSGQTSHLSFRRGSGPLKVQTISLSGQSCFEVPAESTPVLTITSI